MLRGGPAFINAEPKAYHTATHGWRTLSGEWHACIYFSKTVGVQLSSPLPPPFRPSSTYLRPSCAPPFHLSPHDTPVSLHPTTPIYTHLLLHNTRYPYAPIALRYAGNPEFLPGLVTSTEDGVSVNFDVGWHGASIPLKDVRRVGSSPPLPPSGRGAKTGALHQTPGAKLRSTGSILDLDVGSLGGSTSSVGDQVR